MSKRVPSASNLARATLNQLRVFDAVAKRLSFSRAAEELHLTQPAVSMQVKLLEDHAGLALFERVGRRVYLTEAGQELHHHVDAVARELSEAGDMLDRLKGLSAGRLHIGLVSTAKYFLPVMLGRFMKEHPGISVRLSVSNRAEVLEKLAANEVDFAITGYPSDELDIEATPFAPHPHVMLASPGHPLVTKRRIRFERIAREPFLIREPGSGTRILLERLFSERGLEPRVVTEMPSNETIKQAVMADMGVAFLSLHTFGLELESGHLKVLDVVGLPVVREWYVVHLSAKRLSPAAEAMHRYLVEDAGREIEKRFGALLESAGGSGSRRRAKASAKS